MNQTNGELRSPEDLALVNSSQDKVSDALAHGVCS